MRIERLFAAAAVAAAAGACALDRQQAPPLVGPSEFGLSLAVTASPDVIRQDGQSRSTIAIVARDALAQPVRGLSLSVETLVSGVRVDVGALSSRIVATGQDGRASVTYFAPPAPPTTADDDLTVTVAVTPVGTDFANEKRRTVSILLVRPGVILPPNDRPVARFFYSPATPREADTVQFDGSASSDNGQLVAFSWRFGDGDAGAGIRTTHKYKLAGTYSVVLTVTDDRGLTSSTEPTPVTVVPSADPVASFTISPAEPSVGQQINVNASASTAAPGGAIVSYSWDFGDGSAPAAGVTTSHVYGLPGSYSILLLVTDGAGRRATSVRTVTVR